MAAIRVDRPRPDSAPVPDAGHRTDWPLTTHLASDSGTVATWGRPPLRHPGVTDSSISRGTWLPWLRPALTTIAKPVGPPRSPMHRIRRRRWLAMLMAEFATGVSLRVADKSDRQQQRRAGPDHVGATRPRLPEFGIRSESGSISPRGLRRAEERESGSTRPPKSKAPSPAPLPIRVRR